MPPVSITGSAVSSLEPCTKELSPDPLARSVLAITPGRNGSPTLVPVSQSIQLALSTFRFASESISKALPLGAAPSVAVLLQAAVWLVAVPVAKATTIKSKIAPSTPAPSVRRFIPTPKRPVMFSS